jgi:hypothetical protein
VGCPTEADAEGRLGGVDPPPHPASATTHIAAVTITAPLRREFIVTAGDRSRKDPADKHCRESRIEATQGLHQSTRPGRIENVAGRQSHPGAHPICDVRVCSL